MLEYLAQTISAIGVAIMSIGTNPIAPTRCGNFQEINYCFHKGDPSSDPNHQKIVYFMPGFGDDTTAWTVNGVTSRIEKQWEQDKVERPTVVTISKNVWWYTEKVQGQQLTDFVHWFEENELGTNPSDKAYSRTLYGDSMGGHNAFRWAADFPELFHRLALICPAFPRSFVQSPAPSEGFPPWEYLAQQLVDEYYSRSTAPNYNPLNPPQPYSRFVPRIHLIATDRDDFGFYAGDLAVHKLLSNLAFVSETYEVQSVAHCKIAVSQLAHFLSQ